ncbi:2-oxo acid dehydrogenase subunit E2 [Nakamurella sp. YIM 132087]|uniref:Dihydrolipoamide acetyltransferase component of pyruvate dehydrogenase complex n=1 Tax=Nakamurella alba TaxID=2665158 RepID=A0A7K1FRL7_9ACTN|nr:dihydrolipoamide acetyltransferase family protein [Nakamurella alba]MTD15883.1 2-oxo acid dehydrogenase subunit E2 [Nakamurella alba]
MSIRTFALPDVGEGLTEAEILSWRVAAGDTVEVNQILVEIETAKAAVELPSPFAGRVDRLLVEPGVTVAVGTPIIAVETGTSGDPAAAAPATSGDGGTRIGETGADGRIATLVGFVDPHAGVTRRPRRSRPLDSDELDLDREDIPRAPRREPVAPVPTDTAPDPAAAAPAAAAPAAAAPAAAAPAAAAIPAAVDPTPGVPAPAAPVGGVPAADASAPAAVTGDAAAAPAGLVADPSPAGSLAPKAAPPVRKLAKELGVDLRTIAPARADGIISRAEVEAAAAPSAAPTAAAAPPAPAGAVLAAAGGSGFDPVTRERRIPIKGVRKATAQAMVASAFGAPHVTEFLTVDVTPMIELRDRLRRTPGFADLKIGPLTFAARAVCLALRRTPELNATWDADAGVIVEKQYVHLGIAAATPRGLVVPNIRDADALDLAGLAGALADLTATARAGRTTPAAMSGGTFTITNIGVLGVDTGTPILNPGESGILALGSVKDAPWVVDGQLAVRKVCQLALSFDHRVVDGAQGSRFLADVGALLADPALAITF